MVHVSEVGDVDEQTLIRLPSPSEEEAAPKEPGTMGHRSVEHIDFEEALIKGSRILIIAAAASTFLCVSASATLLGGVIGVGTALYLKGEVGDDFFKSLYSYVPGFKDPTTAKLAVGVGAALSLYFAPALAAGGLAGYLGGSMHASEELLA